MGATFSRVKVWAAEILKFAELNAEFDNILSNLTPAGIDDQSSNTAAMQLTVDPYPGSSASLATSLAGELHRIRYLLAQITGQTHWYQDPDTTLKVSSNYMSQRFWQEQTPVVTYVSGTVFTVPNNLTATYPQGMRIKATVTAGLIYGTVKSSAYTDKTTVTVDWDSGALDAGLSLVAIGVQADNSPMGIAPTISKAADFSLAKTELNRYINCAAISELTCTISNATPGIVGAAGHGLSIGDKFTLTTSGTLPAPLAVGTTYYVLAADFTIDQFKLSTTADGSAINTTTDGSGTHKLSKLVTATIPTATTIPSGIWCCIRNLSLGVVTISGTVDGRTDLALRQNEVLFLYCNQVIWNGVLSQAPAPYYNDSAAYKVLGMNSANTFKAWVDSLQSLFTAQGDIIYASAARTPAALPKGDEGQVLVMGASVPEWADGVPTPIAGTAIGIASADTEQATLSTSYTKLKDIEVLVTGTVTVYFELRRSYDNNGSAIGKIYKNNAAVGTERATAAYIFTEGWYGKSCRYSRR